MLTYADAGRVVQRIMCALASDGVGKGDIVGMYGPASAEAYLLLLAAASSGAVFVPLDYSWPEQVLERVLGQINPKIFFCEDKSYRAFPRIRDMERTVLFEGHGMGPPPGARVFSAWLEHASSEAAIPEVSPGDDAMILFTSGSTGDPKGVVLSQRALHGRGRLNKEWLQWAPDDLYLFQADIHVSMGPVSLVTTLHAGCASLIAPAARRGNVLSLVECIKQYRCTQLITVPMVLRQFVQFKDRIPPAALGSLRMIGCTGSDLAQNTVEAFYDCFHIPVLNFYGATEVSRISAHTRASFPHADGSVGLPVGRVEIVDEQGNVLENGATGELRFKNDYFMTGYYRNPELTSAVIRDGWYYTGDLARIRPDGHIVLMGRKRHFIKHGNGELICLEEVEAALEKHSRVREAAVCGFTSARGDERLAAFIVPEGQPEDTGAFFRELRRHLQAGLSSYKVPALFYLKEQLPRTNLGKVLREPLKKEIVES